MEEMQWSVVWQDNQSEAEGKGITLTVVWPAICSTGLHHGRQRSDKRHECGPDVTRTLRWMCGAMKRRSGMDTSEGQPEWHVHPKRSRRNGWNGTGMGRGGKKEQHVVRNLTRTAIAGTGKRRKQKGGGRTHVKAIRGPCRSESGRRGGRRV